MNFKVTGDLAVKNKETNTVSRSEATVELSSFTTAQLTPKGLRLVRDMPHMEESMMLPQYISGEVLRCLVDMTATQRNLETLANKENVKRFAGMMQVALEELGPKGPQGEPVNAGIVSPSVSTMGNTAARDAMQFAVMNNWHDSFQATVDGLVVSIDTPHNVGHHRPVSNMLTTLLFERADAADRLHDLERVVRTVNINTRQGKAADLYKWAIQGIAAILAGDSYAIDPPEGLTKAQTAAEFSANSPAKQRIDGRIVSVSTPCVYPDGAVQIDYNFATQDYHGNYRGGGGDSLYIPPGQVGIIAHAMNDAMAIISKTASASVHGQSPDAPPDTKLDLSNPDDLKPKHP